MMDMPVLVQPPIVACVGQILLMEKTAAARHRTYNEPTTSSLVKQCSNYRGIAALYHFMHKADSRNQNTDVTTQDKCEMV